MRTVTALAIAATAAFSASTAAAQDQRIGVFVAPQISTLGLGAEVGYQVNDYVAIRGGANAFNISRSFKVDNVDYDGDVKLKSFGAMADVFPFGGGFRVTGGLRLNYNEGELTGTPMGGNYTINGRSYSAADVGQLEGEVTFNRVAPYLGIGWMGSVFSPNLYVGADLGVMFQGKPKVKLGATNSSIAGTFATDIEAERRKVEDDLKDFRFYPVLAVSVGYRF